MDISVTNERTRLARERPEQILGVFIRDVESGEVIDDPTGWKAIGATSLNGEPWPRRSWSTSTTSSRATTPAAYSLPSDQEYFTTARHSAEPEPILDMTPQPRRPASSHFPTTPVSAASIRSNNTVGSSSTTSSAQRMTEAERKRNDLQLRVWRARTQMPGHIPLRIFRAPAECVEAEEVLGKEKL